MTCLFRAKENISLESLGGLVLHGFLRPGKLEAVGLTKKVQCLLLRPVTLPGPSNRPKMPRQGISARMNRPSKF